MRRLLPQALWKEALKANESLERRLALIAEDGVDLAWQRGQLRRFAWREVEAPREGEKAWFRWTSSCSSHVDGDVLVRGRGRRVDRRTKPKRACQRDGRLEPREDLPIFGKPFDGAIAARAVRPMDRSIRVRLHVGVFHILEGVGEAVQVRRH